MIYGMDVLDNLVICGLIAPVADEGLVRRGLGGFEDNQNRGFHS